MQNDIFSEYQSLINRVQGQVNEVRHEGRVITFDQVRFVEDITVSEVQNEIAEIYLSVSEYLSNTVRHYFWRMTGQYKGNSPDLRVLREEQLLQKRFDRQYGCLPLPLYHYP